MQARNKTVAITGGTGLLGAYLCEAFLQKGYAVRTNARRKPTRAIEGVEYQEGDILDVVFLAKFIEGADVVVHNAAVVSFSKKEKAAMNLVNVRGTANVVNMCLELQTPRFIHVSSVATLGRAGNELADEKSRPKSSDRISNYGKSKIAAEKEVFRGVAEGLNAALVLPSVILGKAPNNGTSLSLIALAVKLGAFYPVGANGFVYAGDVAHAVLKLAEDDNFPVGEKYILNGANSTYRDVFTAIRALHSLSASRYRIPPLLGRLTAGIMETFGSNKLSSESMRVAEGVYRYNANRFTEKYTFGFTPIKEALTRICSD